MGEFIFNVILLGIFTGMLGASTQIEIWNGYIGARYWPMMVAAIAVLMLLIKTIRIWRALSVEERRFGNLQLSEQGIPRLIASFVVCTLYVLALPVAGFLVSTFVFGCALSWLLGAHSIPKILIAGFSASVPIFVIFVWALDIRLARGTGILYEISLFLEKLV